MEKLLVSETNYIQKVATMDDFELNLNDVLVDTFNYILKYEEMMLRKTLRVPVTVTEVHMIEAVGKQDDGEVTVSKLASSLGIALPTATVAVQKLESKGFITKIPCKTDGRRTIISLTDLGRKIEWGHRNFHKKMVMNISSQFVDTEKDILLKAVKTLNEFFKAKVTA